MSGRRGFAIIERDEEMVPCDRCGDPWMCRDLVVVFLGVSRNRRAWGQNVSVEAWCPPCMETDRRWAFVEIRRRERIDADGIAYLLSRPWARAVWDQVESAYVRLNAYAIWQSDTAAADRLMQRRHDPDLWVTRAVDEAER